MKHVLLILTLIYSFSIGYAQNTDCVNAEQLCNPTETFSYNVGIGGDDFANPNNSAGCLFDDEVNANWYFITFDESGDFELNIQNRPPNNDPFDLDFAIFDGSNGCGNLGSPIRCSMARGDNSSVNGWPSDDGSPSGGSTSATGTSPYATDNNENPATLNPTHGFTSTLSVNVGETYYILVTTKVVPNSGHDIEISWNLDASSCTPLPAELLSFTGIQVYKNMSKISWSVTGEVNVGGYAVYKKTESVDEMMVGFVHVDSTFGGNGNNFYDYHDYTFNESAYYKLKTLDYDGTSSESEWVYVQRIIDGDDYKVIPNPVTSEVVMPDESNMIINTNGQTLFMGEGRETVNVETYPKGMYFILTETSNYKFIKQ